MSRTVTVNVLDRVLPAPSVAVTVTVVDAEREHVPEACE